MAAYTKLIVCVIVCMYVAAYVHCKLEKSPLVHAKVEPWMTSAYGTHTTLHVCSSRLAGIVMMQCPGILLSPFMLVLHKTIGMCSSI